MGTRGAVGFKVDDRYVIYYNHYDSYPGGLGGEVVSFCKELAAGGYGSMDEVKERVRNVKFVSDSPPTEEEISRYVELGFFDSRVSRGNVHDWYSLLRNCQMAEGLRNIASGTQFHIEDAQKFIKDSLFCEYAYIVNLDNMTLEFYNGFQHRPQEGNPFGSDFSHMSESYLEGKDMDIYYPCKFMGAYPISDIPINWMDLYEEYVIRNTTMPELFWSNELGWIENSDFDNEVQTVNGRELDFDDLVTRFDVPDKEKFSLPVDGEWVTADAIER